jgi:phage terminase small subunit
VLSARQRRFVEAVLTDLDPEAAAESTDASPAHALLGNPAVVRALRRGLMERAEESGMLADRVVAEWSAVGFADMGDYLAFNADGEALLDFGRMPPGATRAIAEITQDEYTEGRGEAARRVRRTRFKLHSKLAALDSLARHLGMFVERHEHGGRDGETLHGVLIIPGAGGEEAWAAAAAGQQSEDGGPTRR